MPTFPRPKLTGDLTPSELADRFHAEWLSAHPFEASQYGIPGYDDLVPDVSEAGDAARRATVEATLADAARIDRSKLSDADAITLDCVVEHGRQELAGLDSAPGEHVVTAMPLGGPAELLAVAARTVLADAKAASDYLVRLRSSGALIDQESERLRIGWEKGRVPVAPLVAQAIDWAEGVLGPPVPLAVTTPQPPAGWKGEAAWQEERDSVAAEVVKPALGRWVQLLRDLSAGARPPERAGLVHLPGGEADYARAIRTHTTLDLSPEQLHRRGLDELGALEDRAAELGEALGLGQLAAAHAAVRASSSQRRPREAMEAAERAIRRAEAQMAEVFPQPLPSPCGVAPMPPVVAASGMAPHYTPPRLDGGRPGTYWFNTEVPTAGTGWDLEGVAFHEAVPGHHLQLSRIQMLADLPDLQRLGHLTVFGEGWGLYAEQLAEEIGLYSDARSLLGASGAALMRAARLVVDTGLHAFGWTRDQASEFLVAHVPLPPTFLAAETDRYIAWPGQALAYLTGKLEILRLRDEARSRLGTSFNLPAFHAAILDSGSLPMPVLRRSVEAWIIAYGPRG